MTDLTLWYEEPAQEWTEALPLGNGRLGAMVFGDPGKELLQFNESTLWSGGPYAPINPEALPNLAAVRELIFAGRYAEAEALANQHLMARPLLQMSYQPAGDLTLAFGHSGPVSDYRRELDLERAVATTRYRREDVTYTSEAFVSAADGVLVTRLTADRPGSLTLAVGLSSPQPGATSAIGTDTLRFTGTNRGEHGVASALRVQIDVRLQQQGGTLHANGPTLQVTGADDLILLVDIATSFRRFNDVSGDPAGAIDARMSAAALKSYSDLLARHMQEHQRLFSRLSLDLGTSPAATLPTRLRVDRQDLTSDPALASLYLQYGRYLMISSSRPGTQPANLQGIWNKETSPPWGSKYTANINLQMNYWLPDPANLTECMAPLLDMVEDLAISGAAMAKAHYSARGWMMHHNTDLWRATGPIDGAKWGLWPMGGAWLCVQLWEHAQYSEDEALVARLYPLIRGAVEFILDVLTPLPGTAFAVTVPSLSPENVHPFGAALCAGPTMDNQIIRDLFDAALAAGERLGGDHALRDAIAAARQKPPPDRIGKAGQLQEWLEDWDLDVPEPEHRHVSHLYGLYPSHQITLDDTPALAAAARRSLELRGDEATGWGIGWRLNLWARLRDGEHAHAILALLLGPERTYPNLFDAHPPFQIDGNFGGAAGILEMLVQSGPAGLHLLPALPRAWPDGQLKGVRAKGGLTLEIEWTGGRLAGLRILATRDQTVRVRYRGTAVEVNVARQWVEVPVAGFA